MLLQLSPRFSTHLPGPPFSFSCMGFSFSTHPRALSLTLSHSVCPAYSCGLVSNLGFPPELQTSIYSCPVDTSSVTHLGQTRSDPDQLRLWYSPTIHFLKPGIPLLPSPSYLELTPKFCGSPTSAPLDSIHYSPCHCCCLLPGQDSCSPVQLQQPADWLPRPQCGALWSVVPLLPAVCSS